MADIWMDVDVALAEVPVNLMPLIDDTDFKTIEDAVAYNAAGMALFWHFVTSAGAYTVTAVTPTTAGTYDWTDQGTAGVYTIEIPASGGASINNDTEGYGWFTGKATGVLPWRGPVIGFRAAALNDALCDGGDNLDVNAVQWLGTACATPTVAGVPEVDLTHVAGATTNVSALATNVDAILTDTGTTLDARIPAALVSGRMDVSVGAMATGVVTATAIAADAITDAKVASDVTIASVTGAVGSVTGAVGSVTGAVGSVTAGVTVTTNNDKTGYALSSSGVQAVWDALTSALTTAGSIGKFIVDNLSPLVSGTADAGGSTTTMVDAARTEAATDHWKGQAIVFTSGTNLGLGALITAFDAATDTITFTPAVPAAIGAGVTYQILPVAQAILAGLVHTGATVPTVTTLTGNTAQTGDAFARIGALGAGLTGIPWNAAWDAEVQSEVDDALNTAISELGVAAPTATPTVRTALMLMYMALRNKLVVQTSGIDAIEIYNDAGTKICAKTITDDGADYTENEMA